MSETGFECALPEVAADDDPLGGAVGAAVRSRFHVTDGPVRTVDRVWLDTFDWRLHAAGLRLAYTVGDGAHSLVLGPGAGESVQRLSAPVHWPSLVEDLPEGPLRERLRPVAGIRALLPIADTRSTIHELRILNAEEKTVVRARVERSASSPPRLSLVPVRGYARQAERVATLVAAVPEVAPGSGSDLDAALATAGRRPGGEAGPTAIQLRPGQGSADALARLLLGLLDVVEANVPGTIADWDTEFLHDLRVAVRRTRSALKLAGDALPEGVAKRFAPEFKWLGDLTTPMRDLDTLLLDFDQLTGELVEADAADLDAFRAHLQRHRAGERRRLVRGLRSARFGKLARAWRAELTEMLSPSAGEAPESGPANAEITSDDGPANAAALAATRLRRAWRRVVRLGASIAVDAPPQTLHDLRKRCKELRYVLELFGSLYPAGARRPLVKELKVLQDCLGAFQDAEVHRDVVRLHAVAMMDAPAASAATMLAMGELVARLGRRQRRAARESVTRFERFATPRNERRIAIATETP
ncbi:MAG: CHAD domain-containing protein [Dactylosporangium sp.]|nr:CHAD domain-containing protein [Dactylosporangium sp.]NNJ62013.1 CHAD domain-containing protein [Dactylosporangium sp.]